MIKNTAFFILTLILINNFSLRSQEVVVSYDASGEISSTTPQDRMNHIAQEKKAIMLEMKVAIELLEKVQSHFQDILKDSYQEARLKSLALVNKIIYSNEFSITLEQVSSYQLKRIVNDLVKFEDIVINPSNYPLVSKIEEELKIADFDTITEQLFNTLYVVAAIIKGSRSLLSKLEQAELQLSEQIEQQ